jgi:osmotically-inducible protein OsmY
MLSFPRESRRLRRRPRRPARRLPRRGPARIEAELRGRKDLDIRYVTVDVVDGAVTVSGMVPTRSQIREIDHLVKRTKGVEAALINLVLNE